MVTAISWCFGALAAVGWSLFMVVLAVILVSAWVAVVASGGNWMAILFAAAITASFVPVMRRELSKQREVRATLRNTPPPTPPPATR